MTISERLRRLRDRRGWTQDEAAGELGFTRSYISQLESGVKEAGPRFVKKLLLAESSLASKAGGSVSMVREDSPLSIRMIPVICWAQAGVATAFENIPETWEERIPAVVEDENAFAIQIRGDSMEPKYSDGDVAVLLPGIFPRNGDLVIANVKDEGFVFKILTLVNGSPEQLRLTSYNPAYPPYDLPREKFHWIYPVDSVVKKVRR